MRVTKKNSRWLAKRAGRRKLLDGGEILFVAFPASKPQAVMKEDTGKRSCKRTVTSLSLTTMVSFNRSLQRTPGLCCRRHQPGKEPGQITAGSQRHSLT